MWARRTEPELVLPPRHGFVFREALGCVFDGVGWEAEEPRWESGLSVFDRLTQGQQQAALLTIARALLDERVPAPPVTAVLAAAAGATYDMLLGLIEIDTISEDGGTDLRRQVLAAVEAMDYWTQVNAGLAPGEAPAEPPTPSCANLDEWAHLVNALRDQVTITTSRWRTSSSTWTRGPPGPSNA
jgi:hypothetical protein